MSQDARSAIGDLVHRYSDAVTRRDDGQWSSCWAEDAGWTLRSDRIAVGRDAIVEMWRQAMATLDGVVQVVLNGSVCVEGPTAARGRWYICEYFRPVAGEASMLLAHYDDTYVEHGRRWLFASRTLVPHYQGPPDLTGTFHPERKRA
jgi:SnoaL-like domain